jgi:hypothetical protein
VGTYAKRTSSHLFMFHGVHPDAFLDMLEIASLVDSQRLT